MPPLDRGEPSASFKVRGRELRVDFLAPAAGKESSVVLLPRLEIAARALPHLGYLLEEVSPAVVLHDDGIPVNVPDPARFALHKLWLARERPVAFQTRARKDRLQGAHLLEVLLRDRPGDLPAAWRALPAAVRRGVRQELETLGRIEAVAGG